jgi:hypothetical protein
MKSKSSQSEKSRENRDLFLVVFFHSESCELVVLNAVLFRDRSITHASQGTRHGDRLLTRNGQNQEGEEESGDETETAD